MNTAPSACPYCGASNWGSPWCGTCGAQLVDQPGQWPSQPEAAATRSPLDLVATAVAAAAVLLALLSSLLDWIGPISYWQFKASDDITLLLLSFASFGVMGVRLALPGSRVVRAVLALLLPALVSLLVFDVFEIVVRLVDQGEAPDVGVVVAVVAILGLLAAEGLVVAADTLAVGVTHSGRDALTTVGLALLAFAAVLAFATSFLPFNDRGSLWEYQMGADILFLLLQLAVLAAVAVALALPRARVPATIAMALGSLLAFTLLSGGLNGVAGDAVEAWELTSLLLCGPVALLGACLVALRAYPGPRPAHQ